MVAKREGDKRVGEIGNSDYVKTSSYIMNKSWGVIDSIKDFRVEKIFCIFNDGHLS